MDKQKLEEVRQLAMSMTSHPVAFGTIEHTEKAGELLGLLWQEVLRLQCDLKDAQAELKRLRVENAALKRDLEYARGGLTKGRTRMREDVTRLQHEVEQLRAKNDALAREAHAWWTAARDAAKAERARCALRVALHSQYPIETDYDRGYDKARKDAAETLRTMGDDAGLELGPNAGGNGLGPACRDKSR